MKKNLIIFLFVLIKIVLQMILKMLQKPLWLGITLKKRGKCKIIQPEWMFPEQLQLYLDSEKRNIDSYFFILPFHNIEIALQLLDV